MKFLLTLSSIFILSLILMTNSAEAQRVSAGGGIGFGSQSENLNFQVNLYYSPAGSPFRFGGDVGYHMPEKNSLTRLDVIESNANLHYMAVDEELLSIYSITGLNVTHSRLKTTSDNQPSTTDSDTKTGLNLGIGGEFNTGKGRTFAEVKYVTGRSNGDSWVVGGGVRIRL